MWYESVVGLLNHCDLDDSDSVVIIYIIYNLSSNDAFFAVSMRVILKLWIWSFVGTPDSVTGADVTMKDGQASHGSLSNPTWNSFEFHIVRTTPSCTMLLAMGIWRFSRPSNLGYQIRSWLLEKCQELLEGTEKEWPNDSWNVLRNSPWAQILNRCFFAPLHFRTWMVGEGHGFCILDVGVSENWDTPKWMVKIMENLIQMDDFGGKTHYFQKHPYGMWKTWLVIMENQTWGKGQTVLDAARVNRKGQVWNQAK